MTKETKEKLSASVAGFRLPTYPEIPDVGLYLEQTAKYLSDCLSPVQDIPVTGSMISNYVKKGLIAKPVRKQYSREQIAQLMFIAVAKMVMSIEDLHLMMQIQRETYSSEIAYTYFGKEFKHVLSYVFGETETIHPIEPDATDEKTMLRNMIITVAHKVYLDKLLAAIRQEKTVNP